MLDTIAGPSPRCLGGWPTPQQPRGGRCSIIGSRLPRRAAPASAAAAPPRPAPAPRPGRDADGGSAALQPPQQLLVVGAGAAGFFAALRAKAACPALSVTLLEAAPEPLGKVRVSGGGRCNVTTGRADVLADRGALAAHYPRGRMELRGDYFRGFGPADTAAWFAQRGVQLKTEADGRMFPITDSSATVIDCLLAEARKVGVVLRPRARVTAVRRLGPGGRPMAGDAAAASGGAASAGEVSGRGLFEIDVAAGGPASSSGASAPAPPPAALGSRLRADYVLLATGGSRAGHALAHSLGHTIIDPVPSLFTFSVPDPALTALAGVSFPRVRARLLVERAALAGTSEADALGCGGARDLVPHLTQEGPLLITHWGLSGPAVLKLSAFGARVLHALAYESTLSIDLLPDLPPAELTALLAANKKASPARRAAGAAPPALAAALPRRFWAFLLASCAGIGEEMTWAGVQAPALGRVATALKAWRVPVGGKGEFKDEFVTAGGVRLAEIDLSTMASKRCPDLYLAGEVIDVDGVTGGFNFQNAWTAGWRAGGAVAAAAAAAGVGAGAGAGGY